MRYLTFAFKTDDMLNKAFHQKLVISKIRFHKNLQVTLVNAYCPKTAFHFTFSVMTGIYNDAQFDRYI